MNQLLISENDLIKGWEKQRGLQKDVATVGKSVDEKFLVQIVTILAHVLNSELFLIIGEQSNQNIVFINNIPWKHLNDIIFY